MYKVCVYLDEVDYYGNPVKTTELAYSEVCESAEDAMKRRDELFHDWNGDAPSNVLVKVQIIGE